MIDVEDYAGIWCVEPVRFGQMSRMASQLDLRKIAGSRVQNPTLYVREGSTAVIDVQGSMTKTGSCLGGCSMLEIRKGIRQANADASVKRIVLAIDSPGGTLAGTADLAGEVKRSKKPVDAFIEDLCCSAAMWVASQCRDIFANNRTATIGSIGTFMALYDVSKAFENQGVRAVVVKAGEFKASGFPGLKIGKEQIDQWQKVIDSAQSQFTQGISEGRGLGIFRAKKLSDGRVHLAAEAQRLGLIDGIKSYDEVVAMAT